MDSLVATAVALAVAASVATSALSYATACEELGRDLIAQQQVVKAADDEYLAACRRSLRLPPTGIAPVGS